MLWRHGDVLIASVEDVPQEAKKLPTAILAHVEITGHSHRIEDPSTVEVWQARGMMFVKVTADWAAVVHEEHKRITLPRGIYRVWQQREYTPQAIVRVSD